MVNTSFHSIYMSHFRAFSHSGPMEMYADSSADLLYKRNCVFIVAGDCGTTDSSRWTLKKGGPLLKQPRSP